MGVEVGFVTDDFDGAFVGADGAVGAESPEFAGFGAGMGDVDVFARGKG